MTVLSCWLATHRPVYARSLLAHRCVTQAGVVHIDCQRENRTRQEPRGVRPCIWALRSETAGFLGNIFNDPLALQVCCCGIAHRMRENVVYKDDKNPDTKTGLSIYIIQTGLPNTVRPSLVDQSTSP